jgi:hypothetical protein
MKELCKTFTDEVASRNALKQPTAGVPSDSDGGFTSCTHERPFSLESKQAHKQNNTQTSNPTIKQFNNQTIKQ